MGMTADEKANVVEGLVDRIGPILHGHDPEVQGAVLADLLAKWLAGHSLAGHFAGADKTANKNMRSELLAAHLTLVWKLVSVYEQRILERTKKREAQ